MKTLAKLLASKPVFRKFSPYLAATLTVGTLALVLNGQPGTVRATSTGPAQVLNDLTEIYQKVQIAELDQLLANFHGALSYGGNITNMMSLWVDDSSLTLNGVSHVGKDAVQAFFLASPYLNNYWVSLAPEYKTQITVDGLTAEFSTQCVAVDLSVTPNVVKGVIQVQGVAVNRGGHWYYKSMNNSSPAPL